MNLLLTKLGNRLTQYLTKPKQQGTQVGTATLEKLAGALRPGDVLLVEVNNRVHISYG